MSSSVIFISDYSFIWMLSSAVAIVGNQHFEGFLLQAISTEDQLPVGQWMLEPENEVQIISCQSNGDTLTHLHGTSKHALFARWLPQQNFSRIYFKSVFMMWFLIKRNDLFIFRSHCQIFVKRIFIIMVPKAKGISCILHIAPYIPLFSVHPFAICHFEVIFQNHSKVRISSVTIG